MILLENHLSMSRPLPTVPIPRNIPAASRIVLVPKLRITRIASYRNTAFRNVIGNRLNKTAVNLMTNVPTA